MNKPNNPAPTLLSELSQARQNERNFEKPAKWNNGKMPARIAKFMVAEGAVNAGLNNIGGGFIGL